MITKFEGKLLVCKRSGKVDWLAYDDHGRYVRIFLNSDVAQSAINDERCMGSVLGIADIEVCPAKELKAFISAVESVLCEPTSGHELDRLNEVYKQFTGREGLLDENP